MERYYPYPRPPNRSRPDIVRNHLTRLGQRSSSRNSMPFELNPEAQRRFSREPQNSDASPRYNPPSSAPYLPPLRSLTSTRRPSAMPPSGLSGARARALDRYAARLRTMPWNRNETNDEVGEAWQQFEPLDRSSRGTRRSANGQIADSQTPLDEERLREDTNSELRALLDFNHSSNHPYSDFAFSTLPPPPPPPPPPQDPAEENRRVKRRRLDSDRLPSSFQGFRYGKYGQVEPGQLTMELVSCDGGIYSDNGHRYAAENILKNDQTVYCTEGPRCNIILRHQGSTVFTLKELIIKAPRSHFTSP
ncbi:hypothetical protein Daesc_008803 [Daldinia eschscholtzii]|uniref:Uncharacterized protein n=1 Tax=Daldinia eschscholtzii TaxID=292717 RepID=A0AAX6MCV5_9PEZI